tara:strand:+ start:618 stop:908 length:291 start_codon:yes stop_codon:yes gene_type:complete
MNYIKGTKEIDYNQNDITKFVPLLNHRGRSVLMIVKGQEQGVVLCDLGSEFVTWRIYRHDDWANTCHGNYFRVDGESREAAFRKAKANFFHRASDV